MNNKPPPLNRHVQKDSDRKKDQIIRMFVSVPQTIASKGRESNRVNNVNG